MCTPVPVRGKQGTHATNHAPFQHTYICCEQPAIVAAGRLQLLLLLLAAIALQGWAFQPQYAPSRPRVGTVRTPGCLQGPQTTARGPLAMTYSMT
jgi:hypothetical protein